MEYRVLIKLYAPEIEEIYEIYIPINKTIGEIAVLLNKLVNELSEAYPIKPDVELYNRRTGALYAKNSVVRDTDIRHGTELIIIS